MKDDVTRRVQDRVVKGLPPIMGDVEELLLALAAKDTEIAGLKRDIIFANGELEKINDKIVALKKPIAKLAALTADLAARGETIVRLEGEVERLETLRKVHRAIIDSETTKWRPVAEELQAQLIEERWQKDRAEWQRDHRCGFEYVEGIAVAQSCDDDRHAYTPDDWRRDAREQWEAEHTVKASPK